MTRCAEPRRSPIASLCRLQPLLVPAVQGVSRLELGVQEEQRLLPKQPQLELGAQGQLQLELGVQEERQVRLELLERELMERVQGARRLPRRLPWRSKMNQCDWVQ
jgi:hypothetical protein